MYRELAKFASSSSHHQAASRVKLESKIVCGRTNSDFPWVLLFGHIVVLQTQLFDLLLLS